MIIPRELCSMLESDQWHSGEARQEIGDKAVPCKSGFTFKSRVWISLIENVFEQCDRKGIKELAIGRS